MLSFVSSMKRTAFASSIWQRRLKILLEETEGEKIL
jgi:hypothetical protein